MDKESKNEVTKNLGKDEESKAVNSETTENNQTSINEKAEGLMGKEKKNNDKMKPYIVIVMLIIIIILLLLKSCAGTDGKVGNFFDLTPDQSAQEGNFERKTAEEIQAELNRKVEEGMINISMNLNIVLEDGESEANLLIYNDPDINRNPQVVEIYRNDTNELIYKSGAIPVGHRIEKAELLVDLDKGEYACTAYFNSVDPSTGQLLGKAGAEVFVSVKN